MALTLRQAEPYCTSSSWSCTPRTSSSSKWPQGPVRCHASARASAAPLAWSQRVLPILPQDMARFADPPAPPSLYHSPDW
eukprot:10964-Rhodomonas_salina.2